MFIRGVGTCNNKYYVYKTICYRHVSAHQSWVPNTIGTNHRYYTIVGSRIIFSPSTTLYTYILTRLRTVYDLFSTKDMVKNVSKNKYKFLL